MQIIMTDKIVRLSGLKVLLRPGTRYVISDQEAYLYKNAEGMRRQTGLTDTFTDIHFSSFNSYERRYAGQPASGKKIAIYRHSAYGDQLIASSIPRYIKFLYPDAKVFYYCHVDMFSFHVGNQFLERGLPIPLPISFDAARNFYDWHVFYEGMLENDGEPDQNCCYDNLFAFCGLQNVPDHFKRPYIFLKPDDYRAMRSWEEDKDIGFNPEEKYIVYHLSPANENRCYPLLLARRFWELFSANFADYRIYVVGLDSDGRRAQMFTGLPRVINMLSKVSTFREHVPLIENANLVVCPDSSIGHLAACFPEVPVISLWGPFSPNDRVKYYGNHYAIFHPELCPHAPCHDHTFQIPEDKCQMSPHYEGIRESMKKVAEKYKAVFPEGPLEWCVCLAGIQPEEILGLADKLLKGHRTMAHAKVIANKELIMPKLKEGEYEEISIKNEKLM